MKTAPNDIDPHPNFHSTPGSPPEVTPLPDSPDIRPEPGYPGVTPDPLPELEPSLPDGDRIDQPATSPEITPIEPTEIQPLP